MSTAKRIAKNVSWTFIGENLTKILTLILSIFLARLLGESDFGIISFALGFTSLFTVLITLGTQNLLVREIIRDKDKTSHFIGNVLSLKLIASLITFILIYIIINLLGYPTNTLLAVYISSMILIVESISNTFYSIFQAFEKLKYRAISKILRVVLRFVITIPFLLMGYGLITVLLIYLAVHIINLIWVMLVCTKKFTKIKFAFDIDTIKHFFIKGIPFAVSSIFVLIYYRIDITMLSKMVGDQVVGWYSAAYTLFDALTFIPIALSSAVLPVAIDYYKNSLEKFTKLFDLSEKIMIYISFPIAFGTTILADKIILLLFSEQYTNSIIALKILVWTVIPMFMIYMMSIVYISMNKEKIGMWILGVCAVINIVLNYFWIPEYGLVGASYATVISELIYFVLFYYYLAKMNFKFKLLKWIWKPLIASLVMSSILILLINYINVIILIIIGIIVYCLTIYLLKGISNYDVTLVKKILKK